MTTKQKAKRLVELSEEVERRRASMFMLQTGGGHVSKRIEAFEKAARDLAAFCEAHAPEIARAYLEGLE